jgi:hypothetical protein
MHTLAPVMTALANMTESNRVQLPENSRRVTGELSGAPPGSGLLRLVFRAQASNRSRSSLLAPRSSLPAAPLLPEENSGGEERERPEIALDRLDGVSITIYDAIAKLISSSRSPEIHKTLGWQPGETNMQGTKQEAAHNRYQLVEEKSWSMERPQP